METRRNTTIKWLVYRPVQTVPEGYPSYRKGEVAPILKWHEYRSHILHKGTDEFWRANSKLDPVMGAYGCYLIRLLKADFTFGWDIINFDDYDGVFVEGDITSSVYLRSKYNGFIIVEPRMPHGLKYPREVTNSVDGILINHEPGIETAKNLNKVNKTNKFFLFPYPTLNVAFLEKHFFKPFEKKKLRIVTYRPSSGPPRKPKIIGAERMKRFRQKIFEKSHVAKTIYMKLLHEPLRKAEKNVVMTERKLTTLKTARYLTEFRRYHPKIEGYMTKAWNMAPNPFIGIDITYADDFYKYVAESYLTILASATFASITLYAACVGTPSVGSKDTTMQNILFPDLSFDEDDVDSIVSAMVRLFEDADFYLKQQQIGLQNVRHWFDDENMTKRFHKCISRFRQECQN